MTFDQAVVQNFKSRKITFWIRVSGISMNPIIKDRDMVLVLPLEHYSVGDVVVRQFKKTLLIHRIVKVKKKKGGIEFYIRGDNLGKFDIVAKPDEIVGSIKMIKRRGIQYEFKNKYKLCIAKISYLNGLVWELYCTGHPFAKHIICILSLIMKRILKKSEKTY